MGGCTDSAGFEARSIRLEVLFDRLLRGEWEGA